SAGQTTQAIRPTAPSATPLTSPSNGASNLNTTIEPPVSTDCKLPSVDDEPFATTTLPSGSNDVDRGDVPDASDAPEAKQESAVPSAQSTQNKVHSPTQADSDADDDKRNTTETDPVRE